MIHAIRTVTVGDNESIIDKPIILYRGDREVEIEFTLLGNEFRFSDDGNVIKSANASHGQLVLNTPSGEHMFSEVSKCQDGNVVFIITKEMIDEFIEIGFYSFQIRLYDSAEMKSRMTIPPVLNGIDIRNPIAAEDETNVVDQGIVDYARIFKDQSNEELPTFDWTGAYNKTEWVHHDVITENKMNKIEDALYSINAINKDSNVVMLNTLDQVKKDADAYVKEHIAEVEADVEEFERNLNTGVEQFKIDMNAHKNEVNEKLEDMENEIAAKLNGFIECGLSSQHTTTTTSIEKLNIDTILCSRGDNLTLIDGSIVVGSGVNTIRVSGQIGWISDISGSYVLEGFVYLNNSYVIRNGITSIGDYLGVPLTSKIIDVQEGDIIRLYVMTKTLEGFTVHDKASSTWVCVEVV